MALSSWDKTFGAKLLTQMSSSVYCGSVSLSPSSQVSTLESFSVTSLPPLTFNGSCSATWESLPAFNAQTLDSLPAFDDCDNYQSLDLEDYHVDFKNWGSSAMRHFGYDLGFVNGRFGMARSSMARTVSESSSCVVRHGLRKADGGRVIIKAISSESGKVPKVDRHALLSEFCLLRTLRHEAVVSAEALLETRFDSCLVLDFPTTTTVQSYVDSRGPLAEAAATGLFAQLLVGLAHIHGFGVAHSGVAPTRMLFDEGARVLKIADFGHARLSSTGCALSTAEEDAASGDESRELAPELAYQAPEQLFQRRWNERADIWAAGLSLHFKMLSRLPFDVQDEITAELLKMGRVPMPISGNCGIFGSLPVRASNTINQCLAVPARSRPSAIELLRHVAPEKTIGREESM